MEDEVVVIELTLRKESKRKWLMGAGKDQAGCGKNE